MGQILGLFGGLDQQDLGHSSGWGNHFSVSPRGEGQRHGSSQLFLAFGSRTGGEEVRQRNTDMGLTLIRAGGALRMT